MCDAISVEVAFSVLPLQPLDMNESVEHENIESAVD